MSKRTLCFTALFAMLLTGFLVGCGLQTVTVADNVRPVVTATSPTAGATGISQSPPITATFSKAMTASTLNTSTFLVSGPGGAAITGTVTYSAANNTATFTPASLLAFSTTYVATITTGATDTASPANSLASNYIWSFTTAPTPTPPTVIATVPVNGAANVPVAQALTATFSTAMNAATINTTTFRVTAGGNAVTGTVTYSATGNIATFTPAVSLPYATTIVATITTGAQNTAGTALVANYVWTFTTASAPVPPTVVSTIPANKATAVALTQVLSATFSVDMAPATINATTFTLTGPGGTPVAGTVSYNSPTFTASFTPAVALLPNTTYVATITTGAQNTAGTALAANYSWTFTTVPLVAPTVISTVPSNGATSVALTQVLSATFSTPMTASTLNNATFLLSSPGGTAVAGTVTYNAATSTASFTPSASLLSNTTYVATITTGAQNTAGTPLAANYTWTFTTTAAPAAPTVTSTNPANKATGVALNQVLSATFSTAMNAATINASTFTLSGPGGVAVAGTVTYSAASLSGSFTPTAALLPATTYVATITTGAQNTAGTALAANYVWTFTTLPAPVPPTVISTVPANGATGVLLTQAISATFSTAMNPTTINASTFTVATSGGVAATGVITYNSTSNTATFTPTTNLTPNVTYVATITTGAQSATGTALSANYVWVFRTVPAPTPPTVISTNPANKASGVALNQSLTATFSEAINPSTINASTFTVTAPGGVAVAGTVTYTVAGSVATFTPTAVFLPLTTYVATITTGAQDLAGTALAANYVWTFTTGAAPDTTRPIVIATIPINGATAVPFNQAISATFSKAMNPNTITTSSFTLALPGGAAVNGLVSYAAISNTATFTPMANLLPSTTYTATITTLAADLAGNTLLTNYVWTFTTGPAPDTTRPTITLTNPVANASNIPLNQTVSATFSKAMDPLSINTATFTLTASGGISVPATVTYNAVTFIATLTPTLPLIASTTYTANVTTGATDLAGNSLMAGSVPNPWIFTTNAIVIIVPVDLGTAQLFGGFGGGAGMTNMGTLTVVNGNIGTTGVSTLITGFHDNGPNCIYTETPLNIGYVNGSIVTSPPPPTVGCPTEGTAVTMAQAAQASLDAQTAYAALAAFPNGQDVSTCAGCGGGQAGELGNRTLVAGIYKSAPGSYAITAGDLTLDAKGDPNAFWVFQMGTTFTVGSPQAHRSVLLVNGAQAKNVFWQVGTAATINGILGGGTMTGTIIAQAGISVSTAGVAAVTTINGRALVITGPVTLVNTVINVPAP